MSGTPQGIDPPGSNISGTPSLVLSNWIHSIVQNNPSGPNHIDGMFSQGGEYLTVQGNYIDAPSRADVTACLFFQDRTATGTRSSSATTCRAAATPSTTRPAAAIVVTGNTFAGNGFYADALNVSPGSIGTWTGNMHPNGSVVPSP